MYVVKNEIVLIFSYKMIFFDKLKKLNTKKTFFKLCKG